MRILGLIPFFCCICVLANAQPTLDSSARKMSVAFEKASIDSVGLHVDQRPDSLPYSFSKIDSVRLEFTLAADSIHKKYQSALSKIDAGTREVNDKFDSLNRLNLPTEHFNAKLDSLIITSQNIQAGLNRKFDKLKAQTTGKLNTLDVPPEYQESMNDLTPKINDLNLDMKEMNVPGSSLPDVKGVTNLTNQVGNISDVNNLGKVRDIGNGLPGQIQGYQNHIKDAVPGDLSQVTEQAQGYQEDIKNMTEGNLVDMEKLPETLEQQASKIDGMEKLQNQSGIIDEHKAQLNKLADPKSAKQEAVEITKKAAVDHFAGKQEQLKAAMDKISKYKQKYSSVSSIKDLPKRPPNPMKGKPFIERLIPGVYLQYQRKNFYLIDVNPYVGYKLTGRLSTGLGWNHRFAWDDKTHAFSSRTRIFGPRTYIDFKLGKGFIAHIEGETMNTFVPSTLFGNPDTGERDWVWSFMTGIKKEYRIYKNLKGTALIQYNLFNRYYKAPYVDRLNSRIGFEYVLKKAKKNKTKAVH